ncbi:MAG TPA: hypothetical protein VL172_18405 [Kofleriaceae bacterium]|nr:hypothetical protein [Kofleriaceae bacterium]
MRALLIALLLAACEKDHGKAQPPAPAPEPPAPVDAAPVDPAAAARRKTVEFMEELAAAVDDHRGDCAAMTLAVADVVDRNKPLVDVVRKVRARGDSAERQRQPGQVEFHDKTGDEFADRIAEVKRKLGGLDACMAHSPQLAEMLGEMGKKP